MPSDPLPNRVLQAVRNRLVTLANPNIPTARIYNRGLPQYSPERDGCPALLCFLSPGQPPTRKKTLDGKMLDQGFPVTVVLFTPGNLQPATADPKKPVGAENEWRTRLWDILGAAFHGRPILSWGWPTEVKYMKPNPEAFLDLSAYESAGLWSNAVSFEIQCRTIVSDIVYPDGEPVYPDGEP